MLYSFDWISLDSLDAVQLDVDTAELFLYYRAVGCSLHTVWMLSPCREASSQGLVELAGLGEVSHGGVQKHR